MDFVQFYIYYEWFYRTEGNSNRYGNILRYEEKIFKGIKHFI